MSTSHQAEENKLRLCKASYRDGNPTCLRIKMATISGIPRSVLDFAVSSLEISTSMTEQDTLQNAVPFCPFHLFTSKLSNC